MPDDSSSSENPYQAPDASSAASENVAPLELPFELEGVLSPEDQESIVKENDSRYFFSTSLLVIACFLYPVFISVRLGYNTMNGLPPTNMTNNLFWTWLIFIGISLVVIILRSVLKPKQVKYLESLVRYKFTSNGVTASILPDVSSLYVTWEDCSLFHDFPLHFVVQTNVCQLVIPKRWIEDEIQMEAFQCWITPKIKPGRSGKLQANQQSMLPTEATPEFPADAIQVSGKYTWQEQFVIGLPIVLVYFIPGVVGILLLLYSIYHFLFISESQFGELARVEVKQLIFIAIAIVVQILLLFRFQNRVQASSEFVVTFTEDCVHFSVSTLHEKVEWKSFTSFQNLPIKLKITISDTRSITVPRRFFQSDEDYQQVIELLQRKVGTQNTST